MDHKHINEVDLVERYLMGRLAAEETAEFEEHFVDCLQCVDRLKTTKALISGLRIVACDPKPHTYDPPESNRFWRLLIYRRSFVLACGVLFLVVLAGLVVASNRIRRTQVEADEVRSAFAQSARRYEEERQSSSQAVGKLRESERELTDQVARLQTEIENERKQNLLPKADQYLAWGPPQINPEILDLQSVRGTSSESNEITLPSSPTGFMISVSLEGEVGHKAYRLTILDAGKRQLWKGIASKPNRDNALSIVFNSTFFRPGDYVLRVQGVAGDGSTSIVGEYSFRVRKTP